MSNSVDPDETAHRAVSSGSMLFSLQKPVIIARGSETVNRRHFNMFNPCPAEPGYTLLLQTV